MKIPQTLIAVVALLSIAGSAGAETPKVERKVGSDGVPVISIKGDKPAPPTRVEEAEEVAPARKPFKVYELDREEEAADNKPTIVVVGNPPPIAPSAGYGYGYGYAPSPYYSGYNGFYNSGFYNTGFYNTGFYSRGAYTGNRGRNCSVQRAPANYQNPPVNYQNPPANYRPLNGFYTRRCR